MKNDLIRFRWRPDPPSKVKAAYERVSKKIKKKLRSILPNRPWSNTLRVIVCEGKYRKSEKKQSAMWVMTSNPIDCFWAASLMGCVHQHIAESNPEIKQILISSPKEKSTGYVPIISWRYNGPDQRPKSVRLTEKHMLISHLNWCAATSTSLNNSKLGMELLVFLASSKSLQWEAIESLVNHAIDKEFISNTAEFTLSSMAKYNPDLQPVDNEIPVFSRCDAIKLLAERGILNNFVGRQRPLRPMGTSVGLHDVLSFVASAYRLKVDDLTSRDRRFYIMHARQMAVYIMRNVTSRSLAEIGYTIGNRNHASVINSVMRIECWRMMDPMHSWLVDSFMNIADNIGLLKVHSFKQKVKNELIKAKLNQDLKSSNNQVSNDNLTDDS